MTITEALKITGIRKDELSRITSDALNQVISLTRWELDVFVGNNFGHQHYEKRLEAYNTIKEFIAKKGA